jgi:hypothetical protein
MKHTSLLVQSVSLALKVICEEDISAVTICRGLGGPTIRDVDGSPSFAMQSLFCFCPSQVPRLGVASVAGEEAFRSQSETRAETSKNSLPPPMTTRYRPPAFPRNVKARVIHSLPKMTWCQTLWIRLKT